MALLLQRHMHITLLAIPGLHSALQHLMQQATQQMEDLTPAGTSVLVAALSIIARAPGGAATSRALMDRWYNVSWRRMKKYSALDLAMAAWGLGQMREYPHSGWISRFWVCSKAVVGELDPKPLLMLLLGVANMSGVSPAASWCAPVQQAVLTQLHLMNPSQLSNVMLAFGKLQMAPSPAFMRAYQAAWEARMPELTAKDHAMVLWGFMPNVRATAELLMAIAEQLPRFSTHSLALVVWSLGAMRLKPNKEWMNLVLRQARRSFARCDGRDLAGLLLGLYRLQYNPDTAWLDTFTGTLAGKIGLVPPETYDAIVSLLKLMGYDCSTKPFAWVMDSAAVELMRCSIDSTTSSGCGAIASAVDSVGSGCVKRRKQTVPSLA
eukprot:gene13643-13766_t